MWFTSMNFLFFWVNWAMLVLSHPPLRVELLGTAVIRVIFYLLPSLVFFLFDLLFPVVSASIKAQGDLALPTGNKRAKPGLKELRVAGCAISNLVLSIGMQGVIEYGLTKVLNMRSVVRVTIRLPYPWEIVTDLVRGFVTREILSYAIHRYVLHSRQSPVSRFHRSWYHSLRSPFPLTAHYDHPIPYLFVKFVPVYIPAAVFRFHMLTYMIYLLLLSLEEAFSHSGYTNMPSGLLLGGVSRRADLHVMSGGDGNFGTWGVLDWLCGTTVGETVEENIQQELDDHDVDEKIRNAIADMKRKVLDARKYSNKSETRAKTRRRVNA